MIEVGEFRLRKLDASNWAIERVTIATTGKSEGEEVVVHRSYAGRLEIAISILFSRALLDQEKPGDLLSLQKQVEEARYALIESVKGLDARLAKVEAGLSDASLVADEIIIPEKKEEELV